MKTTNKINQGWSLYDKAVADCQLDNYGVIFLDDLDTPIDNEYQLEDLYQEWLKLNK